MADSLAVSTAPAASDSFVGPRPPLVILYGSQTGCAQEAAERVAREARLQRFTRVRCLHMDAYDKRLLPSQPVVIFVCSTTGQGGVPDNMKSLYRFLLRRDLPTDALTSLNFGVFGLGDSSYPLFNAVARRLHQRLIGLGARALVDRGLADDQATRGVDDALDPWLLQLWSKLREEYPLPPGIEPIDPKTVAIEPKYHVEIVKGGAEQLRNAQPTVHSTHAATAATAAADTDAIVAPPAHRRPVLVAPVTLPPFLQSTPGEYTPVPLRLSCNRRLTPLNHFQDVRHLEFEIPSESHAAAAAFAYEPGDVLLLHPRNVVETDMIGWLERTYGIDYRRDACRITLTSAWKRAQTAAASTSDRDSAAPAAADSDDVEEDVETSELPSFCSVADLFELHLDLLGTPRRFFFEQLSHFSTSELEQERLTDFCNPVYYTDFARYCVREKRMYGEALQDFPHSTPPLDHLVSMVPRLQPRQFSIASAPTMHPRHIHLLLAILEVRTPFKRRRSGVASSFLAGLDPEEGDAFIPCWIKRAQPGAHFRPPSPEKPVICIGPGTGVAPFRAMVQQRAVMRREREQVTFEAEPETDSLASSTLAPWPPVLLFFGNRNRASDYFYADEWSSYARDGVVEVEAVFSRDDADDTGDTSDARLRYVQHALVRRRGAQVARMILRDGGSVLVAGSANAMPKDVRQAIIDVLIQFGPDGTGWTEEKATEYVKDMDKNRRYLVEAW